MKILFWIDSHVLAFAHIGGMSGQFLKRGWGETPQRLSGERKSLQLQNSLTKMNLQMFFLGGLEGWDIPTC